MKHNNHHGDNAYTPESQVIPRFELNIPMPAGAGVPANSSTAPQDSASVIRPRSMRPLAEDLIYQYVTSGDASSERPRDSFTQLLLVLLWIFAFSMVATMIIFLLQGFHVAGFNLDEAALRWLGQGTAAAFLLFMLAMLARVFLQIGTLIRQPKERDRAN